jgi:hypothetical protein
MPWVGFEPTIPAFEQTKTRHALDRAVAVIGRKTNAKENSDTLVYRLIEVRNVQFLDIVHLA